MSTRRINKSLKKKDKSTSANINLDDETLPPKIILTYIAFKYYYALNLTKFKHINHEKKRNSDTKR
jgi:hypothetical protein